MNCKGEFPHLVKMHEQYAKHGMTLVSMNIDPPDDAAVRQKVVEFLNDKHAHFPNLVIAEGAKRKDWLRAVGEEGLPATWVYDRKGKLVEKFNGVKYEEVEELVDDLVNKK